MATDANTIGSGQMSIARNLDITLTVDLDPAGDAIEPSSICAEYETGPTRRRLTRTYRRELRVKAEAAIDALLGLIDSLDGDPDFEPSLGGNNVASIFGSQDLGMNQMSWSHGSKDDREEACEDEGAQCEDEGAIEYQDCGEAPFAFNQEGTKWAYGDNGSVQNWTHPLA